MIIYMATNTISGKLYVGLTKGSFQALLWRHKNSIKKPKQVFQKALRKHGWNNFHFEVIDSDATSYDHLKQLEIWYIEHLKPEYNMTKGGDGTVGVIVTDEARKNYSKAKKGKKLPPQSAERRKITSDFMKNRPGLFTGRQHTKKSIEKMLISRAIHFAHKKGNLCLLQNQ